MNEYIDLIQELIQHTLYIYQKRYKSEQYLMYTQKVQYCADAFNHCLNLVKYDKLFNLSIQSIDEIFKTCIDMIEIYGL